LLSPDGVLVAVVFVAVVFVAVVFVAVVFVAIVPVAVVFVEVMLVGVALVGVALVEDVVIAGAPGTGVGIDLVWVGIVDIASPALRHRRGDYSGAGRSESPIRYSSTPLAQLRPSAIAQTIRDCPRCMSPAAKTPGTLVIQASSRHTVPRSVMRTPS